MRKLIIQVFKGVIDIAILASSFLFFVWLKPASLQHYLPTHLVFFLIIAGLQLMISFLGGKFHSGKIKNLKLLLIRIICCKTVSLAVVIFLLYLFQLYGFSRMIVPGTTVVTTVTKLIFGIIYLAIHKTSIHDQLPVLNQQTIEKKIMQPNLVLFRHNQYKFVA